MLGYVPTLIKLSTVNIIMKTPQGSLLQQVVPDQYKLKRINSMILLIVVTYLSLWTILDNPRPQKDYRLEKESTIVTIYEYTGCASAGRWWEAVAFSFEVILLIATIVLNFSYRGHLKELNEYWSLSILIYSHFFFLVMRILFLMLFYSRMIPNTLYLKITSLWIILDSLLASSVYFFPKFYMVITGYEKVLQPVVRLVASGKEPCFELPKDCDFHVFASHVWSTGQAQTHAIVHKLQLHSPDIKVWLDVDNLHDLSSLEESVSASSVFMLYYSQNYFRSKNCRREIRAAIKMNKPILIVFDGNHESVLRDMRQECLAESDSADSAADILGFINQVFNKRRSIIMSSHIYVQWLKEKEFNAATLNRMYLFILSHLPYYKNNPRDLVSGISVPGELGEVSFKTPIDVLVFSQNIGAEELALELKDYELTTSNPFIQIHDAVEYLGELNAEESLSLNGNRELLSRSQDSSTIREKKSAQLLLYLNKYTFDQNDDESNKEKLIWVIETCLKNDIKVVLVYETEESLGACSFDLYLDQLPLTLKTPPFNLFNDLAIPLYSNAIYRDVSFKKICDKLGASCTLAPQKSSSYLLSQYIRNIR